MRSLIETFLRRVIRSGHLQIERASGALFVVGDGNGSPLAIRLTDEAAERELVFNPELVFGELYMDKRLIVTKGSIYDVLELVAQNLWARPPSPARRFLGRLQSALRPLHQRNGAMRAKRNVAHHYDLDGRLYGLFLDPDLQYSCAYFEQHGQHLEEAQLGKKRHIAAKLLLEPGQHVLDVGSGWGGLALYLAEQTGADVTGVTLSKEQLDVSIRRAKAGKLDANVRFWLKDYRGIEETFSRIVSVGMFEHVGLGDYPTFFQKLSDLLTNDGIALVHSIGRIDGGSATNAWITKYIFPGSYVPALSEVLPAIERAGLIVTDVEILRLHYAETLKAWRERFLARRVDAISLYDERFALMWEFYLAGCEVGFRYGGLMVFQIQLAKRLASVPLTRNYIAEREAQLARRDSGPQRPRLKAVERETIDRTGKEQHAPQFL